MARTTKEIDPGPDQGATVLLAQVAARIGRDLTALQSALNGEVGRDWAGRSVVSATLARAMVKAYDEQRDRSARLRAEFNDYVSEFAERRSGYRQRLMIAAYEAARDLAAKQAATRYRDRESIRIASANPLTRNAARDARDRLMSEWDAAHQPLDLPTFNAVEGDVTLPPDVPKRDVLKRAEQLAVDEYVRFQRIGAI